ncbi:MAG: DinB family protein [Roseiarcus sp.]
MIDPTYARAMARYNQWQNESLYTAADGLSDEARRKDRGAFFKSIHATLSHLLWADNMWMSRLSDLPEPAVKIADSTTFVDDWEELKRARVICDEHILGWADRLGAEPIVGELVWRSSTLGGEVGRPRWLVIAHFFNHQTHHRGQVHAMLTAAGAKPRDTDLIMMQG